MRYDNNIITESFGYCVELLGIDIVHDMCESLLEDKISIDISYLINENGLCSSIQNIEKVICSQEHGTVDWKPCYVYRIVS